MIDIDSKEFLEALAQYVQEHGRIAYSSDKVNWTTESLGTETLSSMIVNVAELSCRHVCEKKWNPEGYFVCSGCSAKLKPQGFEKIG